jgi:hypothetical protein
MLKPVLDPVEIADGERRPTSLTESCSTDPTSIST